MICGGPYLEPTKPARRWYPNHTGCVVQLWRDTSRDRLDVGVRMDQRRQRGQWFALKRNEVAPDNTSCSDFVPGGRSASSFGKRSCHDRPGRNSRVEHGPVDGGGQRSGLHAVSRSRWRESGLDSGEPVEEELQTPVGVLIDLVHDELGIGELLFGPSIGGSALHRLADHDDAKEHEL